jgi:hypothetical protein
MRSSALLAATLALGMSAAAFAAKVPKLKPMVLTAGSGKLENGRERLICYHKKAPTHGMDIGRIKISMPGTGGHHVILARPYPGTLEWPPHDCPLTLNYDAWEVIAQSQHPDFDWKLPPGVAVNLEPNQPLLIQTHYLRSGLTQKKSQKYKTKTELFPVDPKTVTAHAGALFLNDRSVCVPPHSESTATSRCTITGEGDASRELKLIGITGHYHFRGKQFDAYRVNADGSRGELLYEYKGFDQPAFQQYSDNPIVLHKGEGLEWQCTYQNDTDKTFCFGPDAAIQEHCILFGQYYPTDSTQEAITCLHDKDADGNDVTSLHIVH